MAAVPGSAARMEPPHGDRGYTVTPQGIEVRLGGSRRVFRFSGDRKRSADLVTRLRVSPDDTRRAAAVEGFLTLSGRVHDRESYGILTGRPQFDFDGDGRGEVLVDPVVEIYVQPMEAWEYDGGEPPFLLAHVEPPRSGTLGSSGDTDGDGVPEIVTLGFDHTRFRPMVGLLKQADPGAFGFSEAARLVGHDTFCACPPANAAVADLDGDHAVEVVYAQSSPGHLSVNERAEGAATYSEVFQRGFDGLLLQRMLVTGDLDDNGRREILMSGVPDASSRVTGLFLYEAEGDDRFRKVWDAGPLDRNQVWLADAGDTDGDGRKEFLVASIDVVLGPGFSERCTLYEYDGAGGFAATWEVSDSVGIFDNLSVGAFDFDGDGRRELICHHKREADYALEVYRNTGDDSYELLTSLALGPETRYGPGREIGFGDFDGDHRPDVVLNATVEGDVVTNIYETADVFPAPPPVANFGAQPLTGVAPLTVLLSDLSEGDVQTRLWNFGDGATSTDAAPTHVYQAPGVYTLTLTVAGPGGSNTKTRAAYVEVRSCPLPALLGRAGVPAADVQVQAVRGFRDRVLASTAAGRSLIDAYYRNAAEVDHLLRERPALGLRTARWLLRALPEIGRAAARQGALTVDAETWAAASRLAEEYEAAGGPDLARDVRAARALIAARATITGAGVRIDLTR